MNVFRDSLAKPVKLISMNVRPHHVRIMERVLIYRETTLVIALPVFQAEIVN